MRVSGHLSPTTASPQKRINFPQAQWPYQCFSCQWTKEFICIWQSSISYCLWKNWIRCIVKNYVRRWYFFFQAQRMLRRIGFLEALINSIVALVSPIEFENNFQLILRHSWNSKLFLLFNKSQHSRAIPRMYFRNNKNLVKNHKILF